MLERKQGAASAGALKHQVWVLKQTKAQEKQYFTGMDVSLTLS